MSLTKLELTPSAGAGDSTKSSALGGLSASDIFVFLLLIAVAVLSYGVFYVPAIFMDDWTSVLERVITGSAKWFDLMDSRHLLFSPFLIQYYLLGIYVPGYSIVLGILYVLMALLLYKIVKRFPLVHQRAFAVVVAILFLVYPTNYTHTWLIMLGVHCAIVLTLLYGYLLLRYIERGRPLILALALVCLLVSLGIYEAQVGVAGAWAVALMLMFRRSPLSRRLSLLLPLILLGLFSLWRTVGYQTVGIDDSYLTRIVITPEVLLSRLLLGYKISLGWGWTYVIEHYLPWVSDDKYAALLLLLVVVAIGWLLRNSGESQSKQGQEADRQAWPTRQRLAYSWPYMGAAMVGLILTGVGYVPTLIIYLPSLSDIGSRFNILATIGGSVTIAACLMVAAIWFARSRRQINYLMLAAALPFIVVGIVTQATVQYHNRVAWRVQQAIWQDLFSLAPNFKDNTSLLFILPGYEDSFRFQSWQRTPLTASWEASSATRLLYHNQTLTADVFFPDVDHPIEPVLTADGVFTQETGRVSPYAQTVAFVYDRATGTLQSLSALPAAWVEGATGPIQLCADCILPETVTDVPLRRLVQN